MPFRTRIKQARKLLSVRKAAISKVGWSRVGSVGCLLGVIISWLVMAEVVSGIEEDYPQPFFITFVGHGGYVLCGLPWLLWRIFPRRNLAEKEQAVDGRNEFFVGYFNWCYYFGASIPLAIFSFISGWLWYLSLPRTSVSGNSAIYQSTCGVVYLLSIVLLKEKATLIKSTSVLVSVGGVFLVSFFGATPAADLEALEDDWDPHKKHPTFLGYALTFFSMCLYALFEVLYKKWASHSADLRPAMNSLRFLLLMGVSTLIFCGPPLMLLDLFGWEEFKVPDWPIVQTMGLLVVLECCFNLFLLLAIVLSSPLFASIGCLLVLPVSVVWDLIFHDYELPFWGLVGVGLIITGFVGFLVTEIKVGTDSANVPFYDYEVVDKAAKSPEGSDLPVVSRATVASAVGSTLELQAVRHPAFVPQSTDSTARELRPFDSGLLNDEPELQAGGSLCSVPLSDQDAP